MAIAIKNIPVLRDKAAQEFVKNADLASANRATVDFSKQAAAAKRILEKAKLK